MHGPRARMRYGQVAAGIRQTGDVAVATFEAAGGITPPVHASEELVGFALDLTWGTTWFDKVHLIPRAGYAFGNIVTAQTGLFEIFNASSRAVTLTAATIAAGLGVSIPLLPSLPYVLGPFSSILNTSLSTRLSPVPIYVLVGINGPATFDEVIEFEFSGGQEVTLHVTGTRIVLLPWRYEIGPTETLEWSTEAQEAQDGTRPARVSDRKQPRQSFQVVYRLDAEDRRRAQLTFAGWQGRLFAFPVYVPDEMLLTVAVSSGTLLTVNTTTDVDLRDGGLLAVIDPTNANTYEVMTVVSHTATTITVLGAIQASHAVGSVVVPVRTVRVTEGLEDQRHLMVLEDFQLSVEVTDNDTGAPTASLGSFPTHRSKLLIDAICVAEGQGPVRSGYSVRVTELDAKTGQVMHEVDWPVSRHAGQIVLHARSRAGLFALRRAMLALRGKQISFFVARSIEDLIIVANVTSGTATLVVENNGLTRFVGVQRPWRDLRFTFTDGTKLTRRINAAVETSSTQETLTLDANWPANRLVAEFVRIEFLEPVIGSDRVEIQHRQRGGHAVFSFPYDTLSD